MRKTASFALVGFLFALGALGQTFSERIRSLASQAPDLKFPSEPETLTPESPLRMAIYRPTGTAPFPALVLVHTCGGLRAEIRDWAREASSRGYVVFVLDSLGPRGLRSVCRPGGPVNIWRGVKDAFDALDHLRRFDFVDPDRVAVMGFSWGAMVALLTAGKDVAEAFAPSQRFAAAVALYPGCYLPPAGERPEIEVLRPDTDRPVLILMGASDTETSATDCVSRLEALKNRGAPVSWHLFPHATHCWDCSSLDNYSRTEPGGKTVVYRYDKPITEDSARRAFEFLGARTRLPPSNRFERNRLP